MKETKPRHKMKYKRIVYNPVILILTTMKLISGSEAPNELQGILESYNHGHKLERIVGMWNKSFENPRESEEEAEGSIERSNSGGSFSSEVGKCIEEQQYQITENFSQGKNIILNCFKTTLMLNVWRSYLGDSQRSSLKLFNGMVEFEKIPTEKCDEENCRKDFGLFHRKKNEYVRMYKKAMERLINERSRFNSYRNRTEEEKAKQLDRINENSQAFLSEVIKNIGNEDIEKMEEEKLKREMADPGLLTMLDALSKSYMVKFRFYPGIAARMMRSNNGGFTFDLELDNSREEPEEKGEEEEESSISTSDESSTREIKDGPQGKDYDDNDENESTNVINIRRKRKKSKNDKRKKLKKKSKKLKKIIPYLLLPMLIQVTLLPFVFKKLFFLAMKALMAGKVALILIGINLLRNTCIQNDDYQKIRVEHYGYKKGEEYGAWINGRSLQDISTMSALSEEPYRGQKLQ